MTKVQRQFRIKDDLFNSLGTVGYSYTKKQTSTDTSHLIQILTQTGRHINVKHKSIQLEVVFMPKLGLSKEFLHLTPKTWVIIGEKKKLNLICSVKVIVQSRRRQATGGKNEFTNQIKDSYPKELSEQTNKT